MNLIQVLLSQPQSELVKRVKSLGVSCNVHSRQQLTEELSSILLDKERLEGEWKNLRRTDRHLLLQMCYHPSHMSISPSELYTCLKRDDREEFQEVLQSLKEKGWVYENDNHFLILPNELKETIQQCYKSEWVEDCIYLPIKEDNNYEIINNLFELMDTIDSKTIPLTKSKTIYKKELTKLLNQLSPNEDIPIEQWRFGYGRHYNMYPDLFSFIYDFCFDQGWIEEGETLITTEKWDKGQSLPMNEILNRMLRFYIRLYKRPIPQLSFIIEVLRSIYSKGDAVEKHQLIVRIKDFVDPYYYDNPDVIVEKRIINMLLYIDFLSSKEIDGCQYIYLHPRLLS